MCITILKMLPLYFVHCGCELISPNYLNVFLILEDCVLYGVLQVPTLINFPAKREDDNYFEASHNTPIFEPFGAGIIFFKF